MRTTHDCTQALNTTPGTGAAIVAQSGVHLLLSSREMSQQDRRENQQLNKVYVWRSAFSCTSLPMFLQETPTFPLSYPCLHLHEFVIRCSCTKQNVVKAMSNFTLGYILAWNITMSQLTRLLEIQIPLLLDNPTSPPSEIQWKPRRWCPPDRPGWSTYTPRCCPVLQHLRQRREIHRWGNQSWRWTHWSPSGCHRMCPPLSAAKEKSKVGRGRWELVISKFLLKVQHWGKKCLQT